MPCVVEVGFFNASATGYSAAALQIALKNRRFGRILAICSHWIQGENQMFLENQRCHLPDVCEIPPNFDAVMIQGLYT